MKKTVFLSLLLVPAFLFSSLVFSQDSKAPEIFFKEKSYTTDEVTEGALIEHTYIVYNRGSAILKIQKVKPG